LDIETLQLPASVKLTLKSLRTWSRMRLANWMGFSRIVAKQAAGEVASSGAVGLLTVGDASQRSFLEGGRALERIWLTGTSLGLCFHPTASLPVFLAHARLGGKELTVKHQQVASEMAGKFEQEFPSLRGRVLQMAFRIGYGPAPAVKSVRRPIDDVLRIVGEERPV
jgi:hypothetical protein